MDAFFDAMIAARAEVHNLSSIRARRHHAVGGSQGLKGQWIKDAAQADNKPKKTVRFGTDEKDCVKPSVHEYELCKADIVAAHISAKDQIALVINAKMEGRRFYRLNRKTVAELERNHQECSAFHWAPDAPETEFFGRWAASDARGLERKASRQQVFHEERARHATAVLRCQHDARRLNVGAERTTEALRQMSLDGSHRSRVFAHRMANGDAAVARTYTVVVESVVARSA